MCCVVFGIGPWRSALGVAGARTSTFYKVRKLGLSVGHALPDPMTSRSAPAWPCGGLCLAKLDHRSMPESSAIRGGHASLDSDPPTRSANLAIRCALPCWSPILQGLAPVVRRFAFLWSTFLISPLGVAGSRTCGPGGSQDRGPVAHRSSIPPRGRRFADLDPPIVSTSLAIRWAMLG